MAWTEKELEAVREAMKKQEELIRPKMVGLEKLMERLKDLEKLMEILKDKEGVDGEN